MPEISVAVVEFGDRSHYQMQYRDPNTGRKKTKSTGVERSGRKRERTEAERVAAKFESELREGRYHEPSKMTWEDFREKYEEEVLSGLAETTQLKVCGVFNTVEDILNPQRLCDLTSSRLSFLQKTLRERGREPDTISGHLAHLKAAIGHAVDWGMLPKMPKIPKVKRGKAGKKMKGRPIATEEFERMLAKVESVVGLKAAPSWRHYLQGLWFSGLRLTESLNLFWDDRDGESFDDRLYVDLTGKRPLLIIPGGEEKGNKDRLLPIAPEFAEFLFATPESERSGRIFDPQNTRSSKRPTPNRVSVLFSKIGEKAGVVVNRTKKHGEDGKTIAKVKYASAHDLRRSFGQRWAACVMPQILMQLMRHESIDTTMKFYVGREAEAAADVLWDAYEKATGRGNTLGNTSPKSSLHPQLEEAASHYGSSS